MNRPSELRRRLRNMRRAGASREMRRWAAQKYRVEEEYHHKRQSCSCACGAETSCCPHWDGRPEAWKHEVLHDLNRAARRHGLRCTALAVMQLIVESRAHLGDAEPIRRKDMAGRLGVDESTVRRALATCAGKSFLVIERDGSQEITRLTVSFHWLRHLATAPLPAPPPRAKKLSPLSTVEAPREAKTPPPAPLGTPTDTYNQSGQQRQKVDESVDNSPPDFQPHRPQVPHETATTPRREAYSLPAAQPVVLSPRGPPG